MYILPGVFTCKKLYTYVIPIMCDGLTTTLRYTRHHLHVYVRQYALIVHITTLRMYVHALSKARFPSVIVYRMSNVVRYVTYSG